MTQCRHDIPAKAVFTAVLGLLSVAGLARAQDSVALTGGLPGDALNPYALTPSAQVTNYVVDLTPKASSWNNSFNFGPIAKASLSSTAQYYNHLIATHVASNRLSAPGSLLRTSYSRWTAAGAGINPVTARNSAGTAIPSAGITAQSFGVAFFEFSGGGNLVFGDFDDDNTIIGLVAGFDPNAMKRLYVSRIVAASNRANPGAGQYATASFGLGGVDEAGNIALYADGFNCTQATNPITDKRIYRVNAAARASTLTNQLTATTIGDLARTTLVYNTTTAITTPTLIPTMVATRPVTLALDMLNRELTEQAAGALTAVTSHLTSGASARGPMTFIARPFGGTSVGANNAGTGLALSRGPSETKTRGISVWGIDTAGTTDLNLRLSLPTAAGGIIDPSDNFNPATHFGSLGNHEFMNYQSQVSFRGPSGPVAGTVLPDGRLLVAAGVAATGGGASTPQSMDNYIAVATVHPATGATSWSIAAHTGNILGAAGGLSKAIVDANGNVIGRLAKASEVTIDASTGPSISPPAVDRVGNIYFLANISLTSPAVKTVGLIRAVRHPVTGAYQLELMAKVGDVIAGQNSARNYQIQFLSVADGDSVDSGSLWPTSIVQDLPSTIANPSALPYGAPQALSVLLLRAKIVYDYNADGQFIDPTMPGGAGSPDQAYNVLLAITPGAKLACQPADIADDQGIPLPTIGVNSGVNEGDYNAFFAGFFDALAYTDIADDQGVAPPRVGMPNSGVNEGDYNAFFQLFFDGCPA